MRPLGCSNLIGEEVYTYLKSLKREEARGELPS